jgi:hypothetical protein
MNRHEPGRRPPAALLAVLLTVLASAAALAEGCGYRLASSPHQLDLGGGTLTLSVPVAANRSRYGRLGPLLTREVIESLSGTPDLILKSGGAQATLSLTIVSVTVGSGSWDVVKTSSWETPEASASRTASMTVEATLVRPDPAGGAAPLTRSAVLSSSRAYMVSPIAGVVESQEAEALDWIIGDITEKIGQVMFNEF